MSDGDNNKIDAMPVAVPVTFVAIAANSLIIVQWFKKVLKPLTSILQLGDFNKQFKNLSLFLATEI